MTLVVESEKTLKIKYDDLNGKETAGERKTVTREGKITRMQNYPFYR